MGSNPITGNFLRVPDGTDRRGVCVRLAYALQRAQRVGTDAKARALLSDEELDEICRALTGKIITMLRCGFRYTNAAGAIGYARIASEFQIEDLAQLSLTAFFEQVRKGNFDRSREPEPYILQIARNQALKHLKLSHREVLQDDPVEIAEPEPVPALDEAKEICDRFEQELDLEDREIFRLCGRLELDQKEVGRRLSLSRDQVYRRWTDIRRRLFRFAARRGWREA